MRRLWSDRSSRRVRTLVTQLARSRLIRESGRMRADIHDGPEQTLQSEAGYSNARPHQPGRRNLLHRTAGPYSWVKNGSGRARTACPLYPQEQTSSGHPGMSVSCASFGLTHRNKERPLREGWLETLATRAAISVTAREPAVYPRRNSLLSRRRAHLRRSAGTPHSPSARPVQSRAGFLFSFSSHCRLIGWQPAYD
jgi:hypothetical protein